MEYSLDATNEEQPYAEYTLNVNAPGFEPVNIAGTEILAGVTAIQEDSSASTFVTEDQTPEIFVIPAHTLYGVYPPKIRKTRSAGKRNRWIVLSRVIVPEYIVVHNGSPRDSYRNRIIM